MSEEGKINNCIVLEDGGRKLICSKYDEINLGDHVRLASSGHYGRVTTKGLGVIAITPWDEWSSMNAEGLPGKVLKGETLLFSAHRFPNIENQ